MQRGEAEGSCRSSCPPALGMVSTSDPGRLETDSSVGKPEQMLLCGSCSLSENKPSGTVNGTLGHSHGPTVINALTQNRAFHTHLVSASYRPPGLQRGKQRGPAFEALSLLRKGVCTQTQRTRTNEKGCDMPQRQHGAAGAASGLRGPHAVGVPMLCGSQPRPRRSSQQASVVSLVPLCSLFGLMSSVLVEFTHCPLSFC